MSVERWFRDVAPEQRWFADKGKSITDVSLAWSFVPERAVDFELHIADLTFADGARSRYVVALDRQQLRDVTSEPEFTEVLVRSLLEPERLPAGLTWEPLAPLPTGLIPGPGKNLGVQQSNTSIKYDGDLLIKLNRRISSGMSPEVELSAVMQRSEDRGATTTTYGSLWLTIPGEQSACIAIASQFVNNVGDGWSAMLDLLRPVQTPSDYVQSLAEVESVAALTASMVGSSRVDLQACKLEYSIVSPK